LKKYRERAKVVAGGTDLLNLMRHRLIEPECLIDLKGISELRGLRYNDVEGLLIGSTVNLSKLIRSPIVQEKAPLLMDAAKAVAAPPLQNMATVGGNVCLDTRCLLYNQSKYWRSSRPICFKAGGTVCNVVRNSDRCHSVFQADVACALVALNAKVKLVEESGERTLPLVEFYTGKGKSPNRLNPTEILAGIWVPPPKVHRLERYEKFSLRAALDFPQVGVAAVIGYDLDGKIKEGNIVINAVSSSPLELKSAGNLLMGKRLDEALIEKTARLAYEASHPVNNTGTSPLYRKKMVRVLVKRTLERFLSR
jgi:4-hydroxybenzoyl-CoA reductase subunit beta